MSTHDCSLYSILSPSHTHNIYRYMVNLSLLKVNTNFLDKYERFFHIVLTLELLQNNILKIMYGIIYYFYVSEDSKRF